MKKETERIWSSAKTILGKTLSKSVFDRWISVIDGSHCEDKTLFLSVPSGLYLNWLLDNYLPVIKSAVRSVDENINNISIIIAKGNVPDETPVSAPAQKKRAAPKKFNKSLNPSYSFDNFVVGSSNNFPHAASLAVAQSPSTVYNPLFIYGGVGLGKTHLMNAIGNFIFLHKKKTVCYISSESFLNDYISALQTRKLATFRNKYRNTDILMIDDVHFLAGKERLQEEFFHTFNSLYNNQKQIVLTSDKPPGDLAGLEKRLVSRFEWGMVTQLEQPDLETRIAILKNKAMEFKSPIPEETILFLAEHIRSNVRRLEGSLIRVSSYMSLNKSLLLTEAEIEHLLNDILEQEHSSVLDIDTIQKKVAECYNISHSDIMGKRRIKIFSFPRQVAMYLSRELTSNSFPSIGKAFNRNHATILHACKTVETKLSDNPELRTTLISIKKSLQ